MREQCRDAPTEVQGLKALLKHHGAHWRAIADHLGGISLGGVDGPVDDPHGNAALIIAAINKKSNVNVNLLSNDPPGDSDTWRRLWQSCFTQIASRKS
jgi:hypothetical protein